MPDRESQLDEILAAYLGRLDAGEPVDRQTLIAAHPELADELAELLSTSDLIDMMAGPRLGEADERSPGETGTQETVAINPAADQQATGIFDAQTQQHTSSASARFRNDRLPRTFGNYELLEELGRGGMGVVYKARQVKLDRLVALKMIIAGRLASEDDVRRFVSEAKAAAKLNHPHIVGIHQIGEEEGHHFYAMDHVSGNSLSLLTRNGPLSSELAARIVRDIAGGVQYAHDAGILHRDLKPANVLLDEWQRPHVTDFGLAKNLGEEQGLTATGAVMGTPSYMSPEQAAGASREISHTTDVYAVGAILYECLTGQPPFRSDTTIETIMDVLHREPTDPAALNENIDDDLRTICLKCLEKQPRDRYSSAQEVEDDLQRYLDGQPIEARPHGLARRTWFWMRDIPVLAALTGRKTTGSTATHYRIQAALILLLLLALLLGVGWQMLPQSLPSHVKYASGSAGGMYHQLGEALAAEVGKRHRDVVIESIKTQGSETNVQLLKSDQADWALLQANAVMGGGAVIGAPLYYEKVFLLLRQDVVERDDLRSAKDLTDQAVALGPEGSGMRYCSLEILEHLGVDPQQIKKNTAAYTDLLDDAETVKPELDGAMITAGLDNPALDRLLSDARFVILPIRARDSLFEDDQSFRPAHHYQADLQRVGYQHPLTGNEATEGIVTVETPAFLAFRRGASDVLVREMLTSLYDSDLVERFDLISRHNAATKWGGWALHPEARRYFEEAAESGR